MSLKPVKLGILVYRLMLTSSSACMIDYPPPEGSVR